MEQEPVVTETEYEFAVIGFDHSPIWGTEEEAYALLEQLGNPPGCYVDSRRKASV